VGLTQCRCARDAVVKRRRLLPVLAAGDLFIDTPRTDFLSVSVNHGTAYCTVLCTPNFLYNCVHSPQSSTVERMNWQRQSE
jgi:hypothetical protein